MRYSKKGLVQSGEFLSQLCFSVVRVILMNNPFGNSAVNRGYGFGIQLRSGFLVVCFNRGKEFLYLRFQRGFDSFVSLGLFVDNQNSFLCGFNIRHNVLLIVSKFS